MPIFYECQRCTACCRWPGQVRVSEEEIIQLAAFTQLPVHDFIQKYTRLTLDRRGLALTDQADGACIFLDGQNCAVQPVKPKQCREFPNLWNFPGFDKLCQAIPRQVSADEYDRLLSHSVQGCRRPGDSVERLGARLGLLSPTGNTTASERGDHRHAG